MWVRCINNQHTALTVGKQYWVSRIVIHKEFGIHYVLANDRGQYKQYERTRFVLI